MPSTGVCYCISPVLFFLRQRQFQYTVALPFRKPLVLLLALHLICSNLRCSFWFLTIFSGESVAIGVQIDFSVMLAAQLAFLALSSQSSGVPLFSGYRGSSPVPISTALPLIELERS